MPVFSANRTYTTCKVEIVLHSYNGVMFGPPNNVHNIYTSDLSLRINSVSEPILFANYTLVIISSRNFEDFCSVSNLVLSHKIERFAAND